MEKIEFQREEDIPDEKVCLKCGHKKLRKCFYRSDASKDGLTIHCRSCIMSSKHGQRDPGPRKDHDDHAKKFLPELEPPKTIPDKVLEAYTQDPDLSKSELAALVGCTASYVSVIFRSPDFLARLRESGAKTLAAGVPLAVRSLMKSVTSSNQEIQFKAASKLLESEKILGADRLELVVNDVSKRSTEELRSILANAKPVIAEQAMEARNELE